MILLYYRRYSNPSVFYINSVNFFRFFPSTFLLQSAFTSSFYQPVILSSSLPSRFFILLCLSIVPVLSYTALLLLPSSSSVISLFFFPAFRAYPVIISSSFLFFYRSASLPWFSLLSTLSCVPPNRSFLLHLLLSTSSSPSSSSSLSYIFYIVDNPKVLSR